MPLETPGIGVSELPRYHSEVVFGTGKAVNLDLSNGNRLLLYSGKLYAKPDSVIKELNDGWTEYFAFLFSDYFVLTKPHDVEDVTKNIVHGRPIPLDLLSISIHSDPRAPTRRSRGLLGSVKSLGKSAHDDPKTHHLEVYPMTITVIGREYSPAILYADTPQARLDWKTKLEEATATENPPVFKIESLNVIPPECKEDGNFAKKVTCSIIFTIPGGYKMIAIGCDEGVWLGFLHDALPMRRVLQIENVTQCAVLEEFKIFLVLANGNLLAYRMEGFVPSDVPTLTLLPAQKLPKKISERIQFFSVGIVNGRTLVIYMNEVGMDSTFHAVEPVVDVLHPVLSGQNTEGNWFRNSYNFFLPGKCYDVIFLATRLAIPRKEHGFEIFDIKGHTSVVIPSKDQTGDTESRYTSQHRKIGKPLTMFPCGEETLLCYNTFGLYVDKFGDPSRKLGVIEWEGSAEHVAQHAQYILLFSSRFIEIRNIETQDCRLCQIILGSDIRCISHGRVSQGAATVPIDGGKKDGPSDMHAVMSITGPDTLKNVGLGIFWVVPRI